MDEPEGAAGPGPDRDGHDRPRGGHGHRHRRVPEDGGDDPGRGDSRAGDGGVGGRGPAVAGGSAELRGARGDAPRGRRRIRLPEEVLRRDGGLPLRLAALHRGGERLHRQPGLGVRDLPGRLPAAERGLGPPRGHPARPDHRLAVRAAAGRGRGRHPVPLASELLRGGLRREGAVGPHGAEDRRHRLRGARHLLLLGLGGLVPPAGAGGDAGLERLRRPSGRRCWPRSGPTTAGTTCPWRRARCRTPAATSRAR